MKKPYVGITGLMHPGEVYAILQGFPSSAETGRKLMVGALVSDKTLDGRPNRQGNRYPATIDRVADIFVDHPDVLNLVHFNTKEEDSDKVLDQMLRIADAAGKNCHGFQLNFKWPPAAMLKRYKNQFPRHVIVLQHKIPWGPYSGDDCQEMISKLSDHAGICDYLLLDPSCGNGEEMDHVKTLKYLKMLKATAIGERIGCVVAGGREAANIWELERIMRTYPDTSIDAEGRLRDADDNLCLPLAQNYVSEVFRRYQKWGVL